MKTPGLGTESLTLQGQTVETQKYQYTYLDDSTDTHHAWYDQEGVLVIMKNIKDEVTFTLMPVAPSPDQLGPAATNRVCPQDFPSLIDIQGTVR